MFSEVLIVIFFPAMIIFGVPVRFCNSARMWRGLAVVPALAVGAAFLSAVPASAGAASPARPAAAKAGAALARPARAALSQGAAGPAVPRAAAGPLTSPPSIPAGTGPAPSATFLSFPVSDRVSLRVNVGSGDALLTTSDISIPQPGSALTLGVAYNSLLAGSSVAQDGSDGWGWFQREGTDIQLIPATGSVTLLGEDGLEGQFTTSGSGYTSPATVHATLVNSSGTTCSGSTYTLTWHATREVMCFSAAGNLTSQTDRNGNTTAYAVNASGQETSVKYTPKNVTAGPTQTVTAAYTGSFLSSLTQTAGYSVKASTGNLSSVSQPDGTLVSFGYDSAHDLTSVGNGAGNTTTLAYNSARQVTSVTQPTTGSGTATTRLDYVSATETQVADPITSQTSPVPSVPNVTYTINSAALVTHTVDQAGDTRSDSYTPLDDVAASTNGVGGQTTNTYGANSGESMTTSQSPTGATASAAYGNTGAAAFDPSTSTDAQGNATTYTYDGAGNPLSSSDALAATAAVTYHPDGVVATSLDPKNGTNATTYSQNTSDQLTGITPPTGNSLGSTTISYDAFGRVSVVTYGNGSTVTYTYDQGNRILQAAYGGGAKTVTITYAYDGAGNLTTETSPTGTITYAYDGLNLVTSRTATSGGGTLSYGYDADGNLTSARDAGGTTTYVYNARNLMNLMTDPAGNLWQFSYDADGRRVTTWFGIPAPSNESTWASRQTTTYDAGGRIARIQAFENSSTSHVVSDVSYCYSPFVSGQACPTTSKTTDTSLLRYATNNQTGTVSQYTYDKGNRLTKATSTGGKTYTYGYDTDGNLTTGAAAGTRTYNSANQISTGGYSYGASGDLTADPANGTLAYNDAAQMISASNAGANGTENFTYAGAGQDQVLSDGTATGITYGLAGPGGVPRVQSYTPALSARPVYVLHDQHGTPLGSLQNGNAASYITDNLGSVTNIISSAGTTTVTYTYDPYGNSTSSAGTGQPTANQIGYTGALTDPAGYFASDGIASTGWTHLGQRWQNPATATFTQQDNLSQLANPANGNRYAYAGDNPTNNIDPTGADFWGCAGAILGTVAAVGGLIAVSVATAGTADVFAAGVLIAGAGTVVEQVGFFSAAAGALGGAFGSVAAC